MNALICGSMACNAIMAFKEQFKNHIFPEQIYDLNVTA